MKTNISAPKAAGLDVPVLYRPQVKTPLTKREGMHIRRCGACGRAPGWNGQRWGLEIRYKGVATFSRNVATSGGLLAS